MVIPKEVKSVIEGLKKAGFEAFIVGGCVRDVLRGAEPVDWDIATLAKPEEIRKVFPKSFYENKFLTVTVQIDTQNPKLKEIEVTTYRKEAKYTDKRHPDEVKFAKTLEEDLSRRDFTINAIAADPPKIIDPYEGQKDLKKRIIRTVGKPDDRFSEDALRMMRAVRLATVLNFEIEEKTAKSIKKNASWLQAISKERIKDELLKMVMTERAADGVELLRKLGLLKYIIPEIEEGYGVAQNKHHIYDCYEHSLFAFRYAVQKGFNIYVRLASLLHDVGKPRTKRGEGLNSTFYNHEVVGAKMTAQILERLRFPKKDIEKIVKLVRYHLFYYNVGEVSESSVRRLVRQVGLENMDELLQVRMADRIGSGVPKAEPYKLRHLRYIIEKVSQDPLSPKMLKVKGNDVMKLLKFQPGPKVGKILAILLEEVIDDPKKNTKDDLEARVKSLGKLSEKELLKLAGKAQEKTEEFESVAQEKMKKKYYV